MIIIEGKDAPLERVTYQELGRGKKVDVPMHPYELTVSVQLLLQKFSDAFENFRTEIVDDFLMTGDRQPQCYFEAGNPHLRECLYKSSQCLVEVLNDYLFTDFFECVLPSEETEHDYSINNIVDLIVGGNTLTIKGMAYKLR